MRFQFLKHTADVKFQSFGETPEQAFENSALALVSTIAPETKINSKKEKIIRIKASDFESLFYTFLEEVLYLLDAEDFLVSEVKNLKINSNPFELDCIFLGDKASDYNFSNSVKAITYNEMFVKQENYQWICQVVLDV